MQSDIAVAISRMKIGLLAAETQRHLNLFIHAAKRNLREKKVSCLSRRNLRARRLHRAVAN
jgi:hypothetical protein